MSVAKQLGVSDQLLRLVDLSFDHAIPILRKSGEPFNPFVLAEGGNKPLLQRFIAPTIESAVTSARVAIERMPAELIRYSLVFDGRVTLDGETHDTVIVEAGERGSEFAVSFALRYRLATPHGQAFEEVGNPKYFARVGNHLGREASFLVFFQAGACDLDRATHSLSEYRFSVNQQADRITATGPSKQEFRIRLSTAAWVRLFAARIGEGTPHAAALRECDARFEVNFDNLDGALDEINTLMEVEVALQDASRGFLFLRWNGHLAEPWQG